MTDREYALRAAQIKGLTVSKPTKRSPEIIAYDFNNKNERGIYPCVIYAKTWAEARAQINAFYGTQF